jgi:hypothetical protein
MGVVVYLSIKASLPDSLVSTKSTGYLRSPEAVMRASRSHGLRERDIGTTVNSPVGGVQRRAQVTVVGGRKLHGHPQTGQTGEDASATWVATSRSILRRSRLWSGWLDQRYRNQKRSSVWTAIAADRASDRIPR